MMRHQVVCDRMFLLVGSSVMNARFGLAKPGCAEETGPPLYVHITVDNC